MKAFGVVLAVIIVAAVLSFLATVVMLLLNVVLNHYGVKELDFASSLALTTFVLLIANVFRWSGKS